MAENQPLPVLLYAEMPSSTGRMAVAARVMVLIAVAFAILTPILMSILSTEVIVITGAGAGLSGCLAFWFGIRTDRRNVAMLGLAHAIVAVAIFAVIDVFEIGPDRAHDPVLVISIIFLLFAVPAAFPIIRHSYAHYPQ